eukprot:6205371-Pleurochrysis_carterae.AAC.1
MPVQREGFDEGRKVGCDGSRFTGGELSGERGAEARVARPGAAVAVAAARVREVRQNAQSGDSRDRLVAGRIRRVFVPRRKRCTGLRGGSPKWEGLSRAGEGRAKKSGAIMSGCSRTTQSASAHQQRSKKASPQKARREKERGAAKDQVVSCVTSGRPCGCHTATLVAERVVLAHRYVSSSCLGWGLPALYRARMCGCHGVAATTRLATRRSQIAIPLLCRPHLDLLRYHFARILHCSALWGWSGRFVCRLLATADGSLQYVVK